MLYFVPRISERYEVSWMYIISGHVSVVLEDRNYFAIIISLIPSLNTIIIISRARR